LWSSNSGTHFSDPEPTNRTVPTSSQTESFSEHWPGVVVGGGFIVVVVVVVVVVELVVGSTVDDIEAARSDALDCSNSFSIESGVVDGVDQPVNSVLAL
jgi:hypothetical protein